MAEIKAGTLLGTVNFGAGRVFPVRAVTFGTNGKLYVGQEYDGGYVIRGRAFALSSSIYFTQASGITDGDLDVLEAGPDGEQAPVGFKEPTGFTTPDGWVAKYDSTGGRYYVPITVQDGNQATGGTLTDIGGAPRSGIVNQVTDFVKNNPLTAVAIGLVIAYLIHSMNQSGKRRKKKFLGLIP